MDAKVSMNASGIFLDALAIVGADEREEYLAGIEEKVPSEVVNEARSLLEAYDGSDPFLEHPYVVIDEVREGDFMATVSAREFPGKFGNHTLLEEVGRGGMGIIYRALEGRLNRMVALKMVKDAGMTTRDEMVRFYAEARAAAGLTHPGIVPVYEAGCHEGQHYYAMGYVEGIDLATAISQKELTLDQKLYIVGKIAEAVDYAHEQGVIHRDLKPGNILLEKQDSGATEEDFYWPLITDFGLAKQLNQDRDLTMTGQILGTPEYMAPEQIMGGPEKPGQAADVYAIGAILYHLLTGHPPHRGSSVWETLLDASKNVPDRVRSYSKTIHRDLETICLRCLEKEPGRRYQSAAEISADLQNYKNHRPLIARRASYAERLIKWCRRNPTAAVAWSLAAIILAMVIWVPLKFAIKSRSHAGELSRQNTLLEKTVSERENFLQVSINEQAGSQLSVAAMLAKDGQMNQAMSVFLAAAELAEKSGDADLESLARYHLGANRQYFWQIKKVLPLTETPRDFWLSPDDREAVVIRGNGSFTLLGMESEETIFQSSSDMRVITAAFSPSGHLLVTGSEDGTIRFWRRGEGGLILDGEIATEIGGMHSLDFSNDGQTMVAGGKGKVIKRWQLPERELLEPDLKIAHSVVSLAVASEEPRMLAFTSEGFVYRWNTDSWARELGPIFCGPDIIGGATNRKGNLANVVHADARYGRTYLLPKQNPEREKYMSYAAQRHLSPLFWSRYSNEEMLTVTSSDDRVIRFGRNQDLRHFPIKLQEPVRRFQFDSREWNLVTMHEAERSLAVWEPPLTWNRGLLYLGSQLHDLRSSCDESVLLAHSGTKLRKISIDGEEGTSRISIKVENELELPASTKLVIPHPERQSVFLISGKLVTERAREVGPETRHFETIISSPMDARLSEDGKLLAILGHDEYSQTILSVCDLESGEVGSHVMGESFTKLVFSSEKPHELILTGGANSLVWFDWKSGEVVRTEVFARGRILTMDVSVEKGWLVVTSADRKSAVFRESNWEQVSVTMVSEERVGLIRFMMNGEFLVAGGMSHRAWIWHARSGMKVGPEFRHVSPIMAIESCEKTGQIYTACENDEVKVWPYPVRDDRPLSEIKNWLSRCISPDF